MPSAFAPPAKSRKATLSSASLEAQNVHSQWHCVTNYFSLIWHKPWERTPVMVTKNSVRKVLLCSGKGWQLQIISHSTKWKEEKGNETHYGVSNGNYCTVHDGVVFVEPKQDLMKRRHRMKKNCAYTEIQYRFMFTSWASGQHCIDYAA